MLIDTLEFQAYQLLPWLKRFQDCWPLDLALRRVHEASRHASMSGLSTTGRAPQNGVFSIFLFHCLLILQLMHVNHHIEDVEDAEEDDNEDSVSPQLSRALAIARLPPDSEASSSTGRPSSLYHRSSSRSVNVSGDSHKRQYASKAGAVHPQLCPVQTFLNSCVPSLERYFDRLWESGVVTENHLHALSQFEAASAMEFLRTDVEMTSFDARLMLSKLSQKFGSQ